MGFLDRITATAPHLDVRHDRGLTSHVIETGEYIGFSYLAGRVNAQLGPKAQWRGHDLTYVAGLGAKVLAVAGDVFGFGEGWSPHANTAANALIGAHFCAKGASDGLKAASTGGGQRSLPAPSGSASLPASPARSTTSLGYIPPAPSPGKFLDLNKVAAIASM